MHHVDTKRKRATALRILAYGVTIVLTVLTTVILLYIALGYRVDRASGHVVRNGLLLVDNKPEAASVYINGALKDVAVPSRFVLKAGTYTLALKRTGYRDWSKSVTLAASSVREVNYPLLIPTKLASRQLVSFPQASLVSQSLDRKLLLSHVTDQPNLLLTELDPKKPTQTAINLPAAVKSENGRYGTFTVVEWALNNKHVLLTQTLPSGAQQLLSLPIEKPAETVNLSTLYGDQTPDTVHYVGGDTEHLYGLKSGTLSKYSAKTVEATTLLQGVRSYQPYSDDTILFDRISQADAQKAEMGLLKDKTVTVIHTNAVTVSPSLLKLARYEDHDYFAVAQTSDNQLQIYKDPLKKPVLKDQLPLVKLGFEAPQKLDFSDSAQFVSVQNGNKLLTYDLEDLKSYITKLPFDLVAGESLIWIDSNHLQANATDGMAYILDYDGTNQQALVTTQPGGRLYFANDYQHAYGIVAEQQLNVVSLVNNKQ